MDLLQCEKDKTMTAKNLLRKEAELQGWVLSKQELNVFSSKMVEFAQHHVEKALKEASKKVNEMPLLQRERPSCKDFILNSYSKKDIK